MPCLHTFNRQGKSDKAKLGLGMCVGGLRLGICVYSLGLHTTWVWAFLCAALVCASWVGPFVWAT